MMRQRAFVKVALCGSGGTLGPTSQALARSDRGKGVLDQADSLNTHNSTPESVAVGSQDW